MSHYRRPWAVLIFCSLLFLGLDFPKFKTGEERAMADFQKAMMHYNAREYSLSREKLLSVISQKSDFPLAKLYLSRSLYQSGEWLDSLQVLEELTKSENDSSLASRLEYLQMEIARQKVSTQEKVYFRSLDGDENRGYRFRNPVDLAVDKNGTIYILSFGTANLIALQPNYEPKWITQGGFARKMKGPVSMTLGENQILVADFPSDYIYIFDTKGNFQDRLGGSGSGLDQFRGPSGITQDINGNYYITDTGNHRILKWNSDFKPLFAFGTSGKGKIQSPAGIQYHKDRIYVLDKYDARIVVFDSEGNFIHQYSHSLLKKPRHIRFMRESMVVSDEISGVLYVDLDRNLWERNKPFLDKTGKVRNVDRPFATFQDKFGYLYLTDYNRNRIDIFSPRSYLLSNLNLDIEKIDISDFPNVHLYFYLKNRRDQTMPGLKREDFSLTENQNTKQYFDLTELKKNHNHIAVSMVYENSELLVNDSKKIHLWMEPFFRGLTHKDRIELIRSDSQATKIKNYSVAQNEFFFLIRSSQTADYINSGKAIYQAITNLSKELGPRAVIYLASGNEPLFTKQFSLQKIAQFARANGIQIYPVLVKSNQEDDSWDSLAEETGGQVFYLNKNSKDLLSSIQNNTDNRYVLSYRSEVKPGLSNRWIPLRLQANFRNFGGVSSGGYFVPNK